MSKYEVYRELRETMGHVLRQVSGISQKQVKRDGIDMTEEAMKYFFSRPGASQTLDAAILADEEDYALQGRHVYVPENSSLVETLWRATCNVRLADLTDFPRAFSVAWPKGTVIDGVEMRGCMVWFGTREERNELGPMMEKWTGCETRLKDTSEHKKSPNEREFHLVFSHGKSDKDRQYLRASVPESWMVECLSSVENMERKLPAYACAALQSTPDERHQQYVLVRCVIQLMVYMMACPGSVRDGWPDGVGATKILQGKRPKTLVFPEQGESSGTHASPRMHMRSWHFRSYPRRCDGSRRDGVVFVRTAMVGARVEPHTIREKK